MEISIYHYFGQTILGKNYTLLLYSVFKVVAIFMLFNRSGSIFYDLRIYRTVIGKHSEFGYAININFVKYLVL